MAQKTKQIIIAVIIIVIAFFIFRYFFANPTPADTALTADNPAGQFIDGQAILTLMNNLKNVNLDDSIFSDKTFASLISFERPLREQIAGRPNPFLPIGADGTGTILPVSTSSTKTKVR